MDPLLKKANERRTELIRELQELDIFIKMHRKLSGEPDAATDLLGDRMIRLASLVSGADGGVRFGVPRFLPKRVLIENTAAELLTAHQPMTTGEILAALEAKGIDVGGTDKAVNLASYLSKSELIVHRRKDGGWFLKANAPEPETETPPATAGTEGS